MSYFRRTWRRDVVWRLADPLYDICQRLDNNEDSPDDAIKYQEAITACGIIAEILRERVVRMTQLGAKAIRLTRSPHTNKIDCSPGSNIIMLYPEMYDRRKEANYLEQYGIRVNYPPFYSLEEAINLSDIPFNGAPL